MEQQNMNALLKLYFKQPNVLYNHLFSSYHQLIEEIIPSNLSKEINYFYDTFSGSKMIRFGFKCDNVGIKPPVNPITNELLSPKEARKKHFNYFGTIVADVVQVMEETDILTGEKRIINIGEKEIDIAIGNVPIMVKSKYCTTSIKNNIMNECKYDPGGYFIIKGQEKVVMCIEKMVDNKILVFGKETEGFDGDWSYTVHINSSNNDWTDNLQIVNIKNRKNGIICISTSQLYDIPIFILFRALGLETDKDIISNITYDLNDIKMLNLLYPSIENSVDDNNVVIKTKEEAESYLLTKIKTHRKLSADEQEAKYQNKIYLDKILRKDLLPHLGDDIPKKIRFLGLMVNKLLLVMLDRKPLDDRDAFDNKRIETPGILIGQLFRQYWKKQLNEISKNFKNKYNPEAPPMNVINMIKPNIIEQGIKSGMSTGIWGMNKNKKGVAQSLQRISWPLVMSNLRRIMAPSLDSSTSKVTSIRRINNIQYQFCCPVETPEGQKIGIVKSLSMMATITSQNLSQKPLIMDLLKDFKKYKHPFEINPLQMEEWGKLFINGDWVAVSKDMYELYTFLIDKRKQNIIDLMTSIYLDYDEKEIRVFYDGGRLIRPVLNVKNNRLLLTDEIVEECNNILKSSESNKGWIKIINKYPDIVSYVDIESSRFIMLAENINKLQESIDNKNREIKYKDNSIINRYGDYRYINYTHCNFHSWTMFGSLACSVPFPNHNQAKQNIIYFSQVKQSIGIYMTSYKDRMDISQVLYHPQIPLVITEGMKYNNMMNLPTGENIIVAILSYGGYNQEDSLIFNQNAIDRGLFRVDTLKKYTDEIKKNPSTSQDDIFIKPDQNKVTGMAQGNYSKLNEKGYVPEETEIKDKDIIIGKVSPIQPTGNNNKVYKDSSIQFKSNVDGVVDRVHTNIYNSDGYEMYNMRVRMERIPIIGDKFSNRHAQKGTLGIALPQKDMPFTEEGMIPDVIMSPHSIPTRMSVGQLIECLASKIGAVDCKFMDGTPFNNYNISDLPNLMKNLGYSPYGTETLYCGMTGKKMKAQIFIGPTYYMRLKHMTLDKVHARSRGPRQALTRQPPDGRAKGGGLRIGEMERDAMIAHGASQFLKERMMECSDIETFHICDDCGLLASKVIDKDYYHCQVCNNSSRISQVNMPYACKLMFQELMSVNIVPKIKVEDTKYD
jgi:DNA-directed RNA polymerase II subunit RPB2